MGHLLLSCPSIHSIPSLPEPPIPSLICDMESGCGRAGFQSTLGRWASWTFWSKCLMMQATCQDQSWTQLQHQLEKARQQLRTTLEGGILETHHAWIHLPQIPTQMVESKVNCKDFPGGPVVKDPSANAGDTGLISGLGRFHMPRGNLVLRVLSLSTTIQKPPCLQPVLHNKRSLHNLKSTHHN